MTGHSTYDIERELRRVGVDLDALGGLVGPAGVSTDDLLTWLRAIPTGLGHAGFMSRLGTTGPVPGAAGKGIPPRDVSFATPDIDTLEAFMRELKRVLPDDLVPFGWGIIDHIDRDDAVAKLKLLPDRAGWDLVRAIIPVVRIDVTDE